MIQERAESAEDVRLCEESTDCMINAVTYAVQQFRDATPIKAEDAFQKIVRSLPGVGLLNPMFNHVRSEPMNAVRTLMCMKL